MFRRRTEQRMAVRREPAHSVQWLVPVGVHRTCFGGLCVLVSATTGCSYNTSCNVRKGGGGLRGNVKKYDNGGEGKVRRILWTAPNNTECFARLIVRVDFSLNIGTRLLRTVARILWDNRPFPRTTEASRRQSASKIATNRPRWPDSAILCRTVTRIPWVTNVFLTRFFSSSELLRRYGHYDQC